MKRPSKKTEMLEVRVSPEDKKAFLEACRKVGRSASGVIRDAMRAYANFGPMTRLPGSTIMIASAFAGAALGAFALIQVTQTADDEPEQRLYGMQIYARLDLNSDRSLTLAELIEAERTGRHVITNPRDGNPLSARSHGLLAGLLLAHDLDSMRLSNAPETIGDTCWEGVNAMWTSYQIHQFDHWDSNQDGFVSSDEFSFVKMAQLRIGFALRDRNADGFITAEDQYLPMRVLPAEDRQTAYGARRSFETDLSVACLVEMALPSIQPDYNNLTDEMMARYREAVAEQDTFQDFDRDGSVTLEEYAAFLGL
jgi:hypothetical protein